MPELSRFYGLIVKMFFDEHNPPHFHVEYAEWKAAVEIETLAIREGSLPPRAAGLVVEWATLHKQELSADWEKVRNHLPPDKIEPLR